MFLESAIKMGVYNTKPTLQMPTKTDRSGNEIEFRYVASEDNLLQLLAKQEYNVANALEQLELIIESYKPDRDEILNSIKE
jgi:hypothetical protein